MITANEMRRIAVSHPDNEGALETAERLIKMAAGSGRRRCELHYRDGDLARDIHDILVDQGFNVAVSYGMLDDAVSVVIVQW